MPSALIESHRAFGYAAESAMADLVDNRIRGRAKQIHIECSWSGPESLLSITDDGRGMTATELFDATRAVLRVKTPRAGSIRPGTIRTRTQNRLLLPVSPAHRHDQVD